MQSNRSKPGRTVRITEEMDAVDIAQIAELAELAEVELSQVTGGAHSSAEKPAAPPLTYGQVLPFPFLRPLK
jgi:hypothetical protein